MGDAGPGLGELGDVGVVHVDAVRHPDVLAEPADRLEVVGRAHPEQLLAEGLLLGRLGAVGVQPDPLAAGEFGGLAQQPGGDRERRAGRERDLQHRVGGGVVVAVDGLLGGGEDRVQLLDGVVRGQAAVLLAAVHRAAQRGEPQAQLLDGLDLGAEDVAAVLGEHVVVVGGGGAAGLEERGGGTLGGGVHEPVVDPGPGRVEGDQPVEEDVVLGQAAGDPLVEVVVGVDQAGGDEVALGVDPAYHVVQPARGGAVADRLDPVAEQDHVAAGVLGVVGVDGGDRGVLDDDPLIGGRGLDCHGDSKGEGRAGTGRMPARWVRTVTGSPSAPTGRTTPRRWPGGWRRGGGTAG